MQIPKQNRPIDRDRRAGAEAAGESGIFASDNLCTCQYGNRMCPENRECSCVDGYPRCVE